MSWLFGKGKGKGKKKPESTADSSAQQSTSATSNNPTFVDTLWSHQIACDRFSASLCDSRHPVSLVDCDTTLSNLKERIKSVTNATSQGSSTSNDPASAYMTVKTLEKLQKEREAWKSFRADLIAEVKAWCYQAYQAGAMLARNYEAYTTTASGITQAAIYYDQALNVETGERSSYLDWYIAEFKRDPRELVQQQQQQEQQQQQPKPSKKKKKGGKKRR
jgi:hypothetical protein